MATKGMSPNKEGLRDIDIVKLKVIKEEASPYRAKQMKNAGDLASVAREFLAGEDRETFITINLDRSHRINSIHVVAVGTLAEAMIHAREVFKAAILSNAACIAIAHNHPSGDPEPSAEDIKATLELIDCGDLLGIKVLDHIIVGDDRYTSFSEPGGRPLSWQNNYFADGQKKSQKEVKEMTNVTKIKSVREGQEIFAYRINEGLFCPQCFQKAEQSLPKDSGVKMHEIPLTADEVGTYICKQCKRTMGVLERKKRSDATNVTKVTNVSNVSNVSDDINISSDINGIRDGRSIKNLQDLQDMIEDCGDKVAFLDDFFAHGHENETEFFSDDGKSGFHIILRNLKEDLDWACTGIQMIGTEKKPENLKPSGKHIADEIRPLREMIEAARSTGKI